MASATEKTSRFDTTRITQEAEVEQSTDPTIRTETDTKGDAGRDPIAVKPDPIEHAVKAMSERNGEKNEIEIKEKERKERSPLRAQMGIRLRPEIYKRLEFYALWTGRKTMGPLLEEAIEEYLNSRADSDGRPLPGRKDIPS